MTGRKFNLQDRRALYLVSGGRCEECGELLPDSWHADHVRPWSRGGVTDVINGQALCPRCNLKKGNKVMMTFENLRPWQKGFVTAYAASVLPDFLLVCLPGGGKTIASLYAAKQWLNNAGLRSRLIVHVSPLTQLKRQFRKSAKKAFGLQFQAEEFDGKPKAGMDGLCFTYAGVAAAAGALRSLVTKYEVLVIFDEPHHMSEDAAWGKQALLAFEFATRRLFMTGTPWRHDMNGMPFISGPDKRREDGSYAADYTFDWPIALQEKPRPIRILAFRHFDYVVEYEDEETGDICSLDSRDRLTKEQQDRWLGGAIRGESMVSKMIEEAHVKLMEVRAHKKDAAGIVVCEGQREADRVAKMLKKVTGVTPHLIVSDDEISDTTVEDFERDQGVWVVSVRKVSEGIDIPRLIVGVFLTNYRTELYFRQFVGRVARNQGTEFDGEAYVFIPKHWLLVEYARKIEEVQAIALKLPSDIPGPDGPGGTGTKTNYLGGRDPEMSGILLPNSKIESSDIASIDGVMARYRALGMTETLAAQLIRDGGIHVEAGMSPPVAPADGFDDLPLEEQMDFYRKKVVKPKVGRYANMLGACNDDSIYKKVSISINDYAGVKSVNDATLDQLKAMSIWLDNKIAEASRKNAF